MPNKYFITVTQAAKILKVCPDTLRNWDRSGQLIAKRTPGGARRYKLSELQNLAKEIIITKKHYNLLTISKAAQYLNISADTLRTWDKKGLISSERTKGGARRFNKSDIIKLKQQI